MNKAATFIIIALLALILGACAAPGDAVEPPVSTTVPVAATDVPVDLSVEALGNLTYRSIFDQPVPLSDGRFEGEPFVEGGASRPTVFLMTEPVAYGDLNGDGQNDAAVLLVSDSGGSGTFIYLAAIESRDGALLNAATTLLGDRNQVRSLIIDGGQIRVDLLSHAADDPECCPTLETMRIFRLVEEQLIENSD
jgi:hypothetical protein